MTTQLQLIIIIIIIYYYYYVPKEKSLVLTFRGSVDLRAHGSIGGSTEKIPSDTTANRSRDLLTSSAVP